MRTHFRAVRPRFVAFKNDLFGCVCLGKLATRLQTLRPQFSHDCKKVKKSLKISKRPKLQNTLKIMKDGQKLNKNDQHMIKMPSLTKKSQK